VLPLGISLAMGLKEEGRTSGVVARGAIGSRGVALYPRVT